MLRIQHRTDHFKKEGISSEMTEPMQEEQHIGQIKRSSQHNQKQDLQQQLDNKSILTRSDSKASSHQRKRHKRSDNDPQPSTSFQVSGRQQSTYYSQVNARLEDFIKYFVKEFEAKLHAYHLIREGEIKKAGRFSDTFSGRIGQGAGGVAGWIIGLFLSSPVGGATLGTTIGKAGGEILGSEIGNKQYKKKVTNLLGLIDHSQKDRANFREELVRAGFDIFQSFEVQFMRVTTSEGPKHAIHQLAKDAVNRAINYMKETDTSITKGIILGKSKIESVLGVPIASSKIKTPGFTIDYEYKSSKKQWSTASLYEKVGLVREEMTSREMMNYYEKKDGKSKPGKYGYRRLFISESWDKLKDQYKPSNNFEESGQFTDYQYILSSKDSEQKSKDILEKINLDDKDLEEERIKKSIEEGRTENRDGFYQLSQMQDIHHGDNNRQHKKTQKAMKRVERRIENSGKKIDEIHEVIVIQKKDQKEEPVWFDVKEPVRLFTGRKKELSYLHKTIHRGSEKVTVISQMTSISGLGGIGKTELTRRYIHEHSKDYDGNVIWINAENEASLIESFDRLAKDKLRISTNDANGKDIKSIVEQVYQFFNRRKSLFIFDNAEKHEYFNKFLPLRSLTPDSNKPYILITSRNREWEKGMEVMDLNELKLEEAIEFVKKGLSISQVDKSQDQEIESLVKKLQCFPLALQQSIAYIEDQRVTIEFEIGDYIKEYEKKAEDLLSSEVFRGIDNDYTKTTYTTWQITIDKIISNKQYGQLALKVLDVIAYFAPENISREIFLNLSSGNEEQLRSAVRLLVKYSMVNGEQKQSILNIHRLVQEVTRKKLKEKGQGKEEENLKEVLRLIEENLEKENLDHAVTAWNYASEYDELVKQFSKLPSQIISKLVDAVRYEEASLFGAMALNTLENTLKLDHPDTLDTKNTIAGVLFKQAKFLEAFEVYKSVFEKRKKLLGEEDLDTLKAWHGMAWALDRLFKYKEALEIFQKILDKRENIYLQGESGNSNILKDILETKDRIGWILINQGEYKKAFDILDEAFKEKKKILGPDNNSTLDTQNTIAVVLSGQNKHEDALETFTQTFEKRKKKLGENHPDTLNTQHHIAGELHALGKHEEAKEAYQKVFEKRKELLGEGHSDTLDSQHEMAATLYNLGKYQEALGIFEKVFEKRSEKLGVALATIHVKHRMAMVLDSLGRCQEALSMYQDVFKTRRETLGANSPRTLNTQRNMLIMYLHGNDLNIVKFLVDNGADFGVHDDDGDTALTWIAGEGKVDAVKYLIEYVEKRNPSSLSKLINGKDKDGRTPLHWAAKGGYQKIVQLLLDKQADPNIQDNNGKTPLNLAQEKLDKDLENDDFKTIRDLLFSVMDESKSQHKEEQALGSVLLEECLPSTNHRKKREAAGECLFTWEDVDEFNIEKYKKRDFRKIEIDSEKFVGYIKDLPEGKRSQMILLADEVKVTGESQSLVNKLIGHQKVISHLNRVGRVSGIAMHGMMAKNVLADFLNGDYQGVAINVGFIAGGQGLAKVAEAASIKGLKLASEGRLLLGRSLKAASPFLVRGTSAFVIYDLVNQIKAFKNGTEEALAGIIGDSIYLGVDAAEIGIEIAEAFEVLEGVSSITGPIVATIGAVVFVGTDIYMAVKRVDKIDKIIHLKGSEKFIEGLRAFIGMQPEKHIEELLEEKQLYNQLVKQGFEYLQQHNDIQRYVFPTGKSVVDSCRTVPYKTNVCDSGGLNGGCFKTRTITRYAEKCTTKFQEDLNNAVVLDEKRADIKWSRAKPDNPRGGQLFCLTQGNYRFAPSYGSYLCESAIGITDLSANKTGSYTLINLGEGEDYAKGFIDIPNIFVVNNGSKRYFGGNQDDTFIVQGSLVKGYFYGEGGVNTLDLTSFASEEESIDVKLHIGQVEDYFQNNAFGMSGINKFLGRKARADYVFITCDSSTSDIKFIDGQGGSKEFADHIKIYDKDCAYEMQIVVRPNTIIYNRAMEGDFHYIVPYALGSAKVDFVYTSKTINLNNIFAFEYEPAQINNIDIRNINVLNKTSHIITFNFSPMSDKEFNITISGASNPSYRLGNNTEIKVGNKGNLYMLEKINKSIDEIIKNYLVVANRLNKMSFFIQSLLSNETVVIGSGNYEIIHNNPLQKSHLVGNGGENVYVIDYEYKALEVNKLPLPEVTIYDFDTESSVDTIDLRNLVQKARNKFSNSFELQILNSANDLLLKATVTEEKPTEDLSVSKMRKHEYFTVRLKDGVNWYNKTHVIVNNVPMRINLDNEWSLKPLPLKFEKDKEVIIVTSQDIEENTELITPKRAGNYTFVRDHGVDLIITNAFDVDITKEDFCTITLSKFYEEPKMKTLSIKFADKEVTLKGYQKQISIAREMNVIAKEYKNQVYSDVFNSIESSPEVITLSDQHIAHRHRHEHNRHRQKTRHRRSDNITSSGTKPSSWINDLFGWIKAKSGLLTTRRVSSVSRWFIDDQDINASSENKSYGSATQNSLKTLDFSQIDVNGTILLADVLLAKRGKRPIYSSLMDQGLLQSQTLGYTLNIGRVFEEVVKKAALKSGMSERRLNIDFLEIEKMEKEINNKIIRGRFDEISQILKSYAEKACPRIEKGSAGMLSPKKFNKFMAEFNNLFLDQSVHQILYNSKNNVLGNDNMQMNQRNSNLENKKPKSYLDNISTQHLTQVRLI